MPRPSADCESETSPAGPARFSRRYTSRLPPATSAPEAMRPALHRMMMEEVLYGCDVMPSAVHITGSTLSGVEPAVLFNSSHLYTMPYGRMADSSVMIGSLELLQFFGRSPRLRTLTRVDLPGFPKEPEDTTKSARLNTAARTAVDPVPCRFAITDRMTYFLSPG